VGRHTSESKTSQRSAPKNVSDVAIVPRDQQPDLRKLFDSLSALVVNVAADHTFKYANPAYAERFAEGSTDLVGRHLRDVIGDAAYLAVLPEIERALSGEPHFYEKLIDFGDSDERYMRVTYTPELDDQGNVLGYFAMITDATDQYRTEQALKSSEERYRAFIAQSSEGIWRFELEKPISLELAIGEQIDLAYKYGYLAECNDAMARQYGFDSADALIGARLGDLLIRDDPNNTEFLRSFMLSGYRLDDAESHERDANGNNRYFLNNFVGIIADGHLLRAWGSQRDITQTKSEEIAQERLAAIVESSEDAILSFDLDKNVTSWNAAAERIYGYTAEEMSGKRLSVLVPEDRLDEENEILQRIKLGEKVKHFETLRRRKDGRIIDVSLTISPIRDRKGLVIGVSKITRDISERKATERALLENRLMLSMAMQSSSMGVWENDLTTGLVIWSNELEDIFGLKSGEFRGTQEHFFQLIHEDDRDAVSHEIQAAVRDKRPFSIEFRFQHADGTVRWMEGRGEAVYSEGGQAARLYGIGMDVTKRKETEEKIREGEERFRLALSSGAVTVYEQDVELRYEWLYPTSLYAPDVIGKTDIEITPGEHGRKLTELKQHVLRTGQPLREEVSADVLGARRWYDLSIEPRSKNGKIIGVGGTALDITSRKNVEGELKRQALLLDAALEPVIVWERGGKIIEWNRGAERLYGFSSDEAIGRITHQLLNTKFPTSYLDIENALLQRGSWIGEVRHTTISGDEIIVESRHQLIDVDGRQLVLEANRDVTEKRRVADELRRSEARLQAMFDSTTVGFAVLDTDAKFLQVNDAFCSITGYGRAEVIDLVLTDLSFPDDVLEMQEKLDGLQSGEIPAFLFEKRFVRKNGDVVWVQNNVSLTRDSDNKPLHLIAIIQDVTARRLAEEALRETEQRFSRFMQQLPGLAWIKDIDGRYVYANEAAERSFGVSKDELFGKTDDEVFSPESASMFKEHDREALESGSGRQFLETMLEDDGVLHYSIVSKFPISGADEKPALIGGMAIDVTDQKQAEEALRRRVDFDEAVVTSMGEGLLTTDAKGSVTSMNPAAERLFGWTFAELHGRRLHDLAHYKHRDGTPNPAEHCSVLSVLESGQPLINQEDVFIHRDGHFFDVLFSSSPLKEEGRTNGSVVVFQDISERKRAEEQLERYKHLSEYASDIIWLLKDDGTIVEANQSAVNTYGYSRDELIGMNVRQLRHPSCAAYVDDQLQSARTGNVYFETVHMRKDGSLLPVEVNASSGEFGGERLIMSILRDITERKREEKDHEFLLKVAELIRNQPDSSILLKDATAMLGEHLELGRCFFSSIDLDDRTSTVLCEYSQDDLVPLEKTVSFDDYSKANLEAALAGETIVVHDTSTDKRTADKFTVSYGREGIRSYIAVPQSRDGLWSGILFACRNEPYEWKDSEVSLIQTVAERVWLAVEKLRSEAALRESERRAMEEYQRLLERIVPLAETLGAARHLHTIYRSLREFILASMQCSGFFVSFYDAENHTRHAAFIWGEGEEIDVSSLPPMEVNNTGGPNSRAILGKQTVITNNYWNEQQKRPHVVLKENGIDPLSSMVVPMVVQDRVIGTVEVQAYQDRAFEREHAIALEMAANLAAVAIENVRLIETEARARAEAETANRMKDEFLSVLSHELRTPLNAMLGWVRILRSGNIDEERTSKALEIIERNTRQQSSLIEDLLDVSRIISAKMRIESELIDLVPALEQAAESVRPLAVAKGIEFDVRTAREPLYLNGDVVRLQQVITNLLQNAIKFTSSGGRVSLDWRRENNSVEVEVTDTGIGIDKDFLPMIFDRFSQADASTRRNNTGLGLGLTIVRTIVEMHGGSASAYSEGPGTGASFKVTLPLAEEYYAPEPPSVSPPFVNGFSDSLSGIRVLLVDDDADGMMPLRFLLEKEKAIVTSVVSAKEALEHLGADDFDILISDIGMPSMDGFELISAVRTQGRHRNNSIKAIAYTAYASEEDRKRILSAGYQIHLAKPLDMDELLGIVRSFGSGIRQRSNGR
jgi:PAS domain S-box-containing protein